DAFFIQKRCFLHPCVILKSSTKRPVLPCNIIESIIIPPLYNNEKNYPDIWWVRAYLYYREE
ncbi:MAG: hypothetical protein ACE5GF_01815, partial [Thermodesulfobacteriota bacterium]